MVEYINQIVSGKFVEVGVNLPQRGGMELNVWDYIYQYE
jgi:hypothetical protein